MAKDAKDQPDQIEQNNVEKHDVHVEHHEESYWRKYIFSTDHKTIGIQYGITALVFLFFGAVPVKPKLYLRYLLEQRRSLEQ